MLNIPEWNKQHNYKGVYDMIFNEGRLCASVYDTIQIWDTQVECYGIGLTDLEETDLEGIRPYYR